MTITTNHRDPAVAHDDAVAFAGNHERMATTARARLYVRLQAIEDLFGVGLATELRRNVDDVLEHNSEQAHYLQDAIAARTRQLEHARTIAGERTDHIGELRAKLDYQESELIRTRARAGKYGYEWLSSAVADLTNHIENSAKRRGVRIPTLVRNYRDGLRTMRQTVRTADREADEVSADAPF